MASNNNNSKIRPSIVSSNSVKSLTGPSPVEAKRNQILQSGNQQAIGELEELDSKLNQFRLKAANIHHQTQQERKIPQVNTVISGPTVSTGKSASSDNSKAKPSHVLSDSEFKDEKEPPLEHKWIFYYDRRGYGGTSSKNHGQNYENNLIEIGSLQTIPAFWHLFNNIKPLGDLELQANVHLFKDGIKPMWEDPANQTGGNWTFSFNQDPDSVNKTETAWFNLCMAIVGELIDTNSDVTGIVLSKRQKGNRISIWLRNTQEDKNRVLSLGAKALQIMELESETEALSSAEFTLHSDAMNYGSWAQKSMSNIASDLNVDTLRQFITQNPESIII